MGVCGFVRVRRFPGQKLPPPTADSTPFLCSCAKKRGGAPKKRAYGCRHGRCWVPPASPTDLKPQHHRRLRQADLSARSTHHVQINLTHQFVPLGLTPKWERRAGPPSSCGGFKALFFGGSTPFLWASTKEMGSNGRTGQRPPPNVTAHTHQAKNKRGNPRRGFPPWTPSCAFVSIKGDSALCGARPGTLSLDPATFEKVDETFIRLVRRACRTWCGATGGGGDSGRSGSGGGARSPAPGCRGGGWSARACL